MVVETARRKLEAQKLRARTVKYQISLPGATHTASLTEVRRTYNARWFHTKKEERM
jgi:hypothetical protein